jgi:hypothetical protein
VSKTWPQSHPARNPSGSLRIEIGQTTSSVNEKLVERHQLKDTKNGINT